MTSSQGQFCWYELMTDDAPSATEFYRRVIGWGAADAGLPDQAYTILSAGETPVGGLMELPQPARDAGARPIWIGYVAVDDVDAAATRIRDAGGSILLPAMDIPGVGRIAMARDPQGAAFSLFRPANVCDAPPPVSGRAPGQVGWHELQAADRETAFGFYAGQFGWKTASTFDMGPMGIYQIFATSDAPVGGMMTRQNGGPEPSWLYYFNVTEIDAAVTRVKDAGGEVIAGPHQVPGGEWIAQCRDPQGAMFAMVSPTRG